MTSFLIFRYLSIFSVLLPLLAGLYFWKWTRGNLRRVFWIAVASFLSDLFSLLLASYKMNTWPVGNMFIIVHFVLLFIALGDQRKIMLLRIFFIGCLAFSVTNYFFIQGTQTFDSYTAYASGILMIISALSFLYELIVEVPTERVQTLPLFWLAFGTLVYYGGTLFLFLFNNYLMAHLPQRHQSYWILHNLLNITKNVFLFATIWVNFKYRSKTSLQ